MYERHNRNLRHELVVRDAGKFILTPGPGLRILDEDHRVFCSSRGNAYVLTHAMQPDNPWSSWRHPELGVVELWSIHTTGEPRWGVATSPALGDEEAVKAFGLTPAHR